MDMDRRANGAVTGSVVTAVPGEQRPALELAAIHKHFGAVHALRGASLVVRPGTVHALLGENGAGKTTLMRIAYGMARPDSGTISMGGTFRKFDTPREAMDAGLGMVHQHFTLVPAMTVAENIALGGMGAYSPHEAARVVERLAGTTGFALDPRAMAGSLPVGAQQRVEIAKALARPTRVLVLDEPTGVLAPAEAEDLLRWLRDFVAQGNAAVLITHKLREALAVADDVTVLRHGARVLSARAADTSESELTSAMIGEPMEPAAATRRPRAQETAVVFSAVNMAVRDAAGHERVHRTSFVIEAGEVVGVVGVEGAGQRELLRALAGRTPVSGGALSAPPIVGFVPEDRHGDAVLMERSLVENVALRGLGSAHGLLDWRASRAETEMMMSNFDVRGGGVSATMRTLSGGNQQKLVLARELGSREADGPLQAIVVENPTRGLDVRATAAIRARIRDAANAGAAVVLYSSDLDEVLSLATRVFVMFNGMLRETPLDRAAIGRAMLGVAE